MNLLISLICSFLLFPQEFELVHFSAQEKDQKIHLKWELSSNTNVAYFKLERSLDNINYEVIERISASEALSYKSVDAHPRQGDLYYRLRLYSKDGQNFSSDPIHIETGKGKTVNIPTGAKWRSDDYHYE